MCYTLVMSGVVCILRVWRADHADLHPSGDNQQHTGTAMMGWRRWCRTSCFYDGVLANHADVGTCSLRRRQHGARRSIQDRQTRPSASGRPAAGCFVFVIFHRPDVLVTQGFTWASSSEPRSAAWSASECGN